MTTREGARALSIEITRGKIVESRHQVSLAVVDSQMQLKLAFGDMNAPVYMRSSAKPFQALALIEKGFAGQLDLNLRQQALICASHAGMDEHAETALSILEKIGLTENHLQCGTHTPFDRITTQQLLVEGGTPSPLRHNCSGKHAGMLLLAHSLGEDIETYLNQGHQTQQVILQAFCEMLGIDKGKVELGTDGCSAPNFAVPLPAAAYGYARLMDPSSLDEERAQACKRIVQAMLSNPDMVAGAGEFDTELMKVSNGRILSKGGAEGYQALGITSSIWPDGGAAGIVLKVQDGDGAKRARSVASLAVLYALDLISREERKHLAGFDQRTLLNFRQIEIGEIRMASESLNRLHKAYERV